MVGGSRLLRVLLLGLWRQWSSDQAAERGGFRQLHVVRRRCRPRAIRERTSSCQWTAVRGERLGLWPHASLASAVPEIDVQPLQPSYA